MSNLDTLQVDDSIQLERQGGILTLWLNRPESRNAMSLNMVNAIQQVFAHIADDVSIRAVILRGKGGHFCAGGDIKDMAGLRVEAANAGSLQPYIDFNRRFGAMIEQVDQAPQTVVAILEGAVLGGGFGWLVFLMSRLVVITPSLDYLKQVWVCYQHKLLLLW